ncbi:MAG TPA: hypothetical protein VHQ93_17575 [Chitinophagaceae bacterium]|nr:hypothetical protein [Chitinophagaceae bacterium]
MWKLFLIEIRLCPSQQHSAVNEWSQLIAVVQCSDDFIRLHESWYNY